MRLLCEQSAGRMAFMESSERWESRIVSEGTSILERKLACQFKDTDRIMTKV